MRKVLKQEFYQLRCRWGVWFFLLAALLGCTLMAIGTPVGTERYRAQIDSKDMALMTKAHFDFHVTYYQQSSKTRHDKELIGLGDVYGLPQGSVKTAEDIYAAMTEAEYCRVMWFGGGLLTLCILLPAVIVSYPLSRGMADWSARFFGSRRNVARAKIWAYSLLCILLSLICALILVFVYARNIVSRQGIGFFLGTLAVHTLLELGMLSVPLYLAFRIPNVYAALGCNTLYGLLCYAVNVAAHYRDGVLFIPFPAFLHGLRDLWQPGASPLTLLLAALVSLAYILGFGLLSVRQFARRGSEADHTV